MVEDTINHRKYAFQILEKCYFYTIIDLEKCKKAEIYTLEKCILMCSVKRMSKQRGELFTIPST